MAAKTKHKGSIEKFQDKSKKKEIPPANTIHSKHKFQKAVIKTLLKKGDVGKEEEWEKDETAQEPLEIPNEIGAVLNLSKKKLKALPVGLLDRMQNVQYLYLEGNGLTELPENFFDKLCNIKWLDLRNNSLLRIPTDGLKFHSCLEFLLLQGNRIRILPLELATISTLKGLQTTGNPITNVPYDVIAQGFQGVITYLKKLCDQDNILLPQSESIVLKPSGSKEEQTVPEPFEEDFIMFDDEQLAQWRQFMKKKCRKLMESDLQYNISLKSHDNTEPQNILVSLRSNPKSSVRRQPFRCGIYNRNKRRITYSALHYKKLRNSRLGYKKKPMTMGMVLEKARKEWNRAQLRETLELQAKKIQRMRDKEVLKSWRDHSHMTMEQLKLLDNYQQYPSKDYANKTPFDIDPEFLNMLNRVDLYRSLKDYENRSKKVKKPKVRITSLDLERQMNEIVYKLQRLDTNEAGDFISPRSKHVHLCSKMNKILDIQKTLKSLQNMNSSMTGLVPLIKPKPKPKPKLNS